MGEMSSRLMEELNCETVFTIPIGGGIDIYESVVVSWIITGILILLSIILTRNLKVHNISKRQAVAELIVTGLMGIVENMIGEKGKKYVSYLTTVLIYIGFSRTYQKNFTV